LFKGSDLQTMSKQVLIITYYWPPGSGPGVQRWLKFAKYLGHFGWDATILTVTDGSYPSTDKSLVNEIPDSVSVHKTKALEPFRLFNLLKGKKGNDSPVGMGDMHKSKSVITRFGLWLRANYFIPDARIGWNVYAYPKAADLLQSGDFKAVITTGPPHSTHLMGLRLQQQFGIKWLADFRDPWTTIYYNKHLPRTKRAHAKDAALETEVLQQADGVLTVSPGLADELSDRAKQVSVLYNGFDESDFALEAKKSSTFDLSYIGNFKENQDVEALWKALKELLEENDSFNAAFRLCITGNITPRLDAYLNKEFPNHYKRKPFVQHMEAVKLMKEAGALLFIIPQAERNHLILTGKIFEYLASGTKMLSIGPKTGNAAEIVASCNQPAMLAYEDKEGIKQGLLKSFERWKKSEVNEISSDVEQFSRKGQTKALAEILNSF